MARRLLVIDDNVPSCRLMAAIFEPQGFAVALAHSAETGLEMARSFAPDVVALDYELPGMSGLEALERLRTSFPEIAVIMLTAHNDVKLAVKTTQLGAYDYLTKPVDTDEVLAVFRRAVEMQDLRREVAQLRRDAVGDTLAAQMGPSPQVADIIDQVATVARSDFTVLVLGETGTGKELVAQAIHRESPRAREAFIAIDCGAIPETLLESELFGHEKGAFSGAERRKEGQFQLAEGGTVFLDEIGNLPMTLQAKLLRALESREVHAVGATRATPMDVRFVAATNIDLQERVAAGQFRADLFFRLAQYTLRLPPLRDRPSDIAHLAQRFLVEARVELRRPVVDFAPEALEVLAQQRWPGNVRELRNVARQAVLRSKTPSVDADMVRALLGSAPEHEPVSTVAVGQRTLKEIADEAAREAERTAIREALLATGGNKTQAARLLRVDFKTLHVKMKQLGIEARES